MSHELRTPLNSMLILSRLLAANSEGNLTDKQVEFARTIHQSGSDLLALINDILDLAKIESGNMEVEPGPVVLAELAEFVERAFRPLAAEKRLDFEVTVREGAPETIVTDEIRVKQVLKNLLSNAFKFTHEGRVALEIDAGTLEDGRRAAVFRVIDTGIGIAKEHQEHIFEAFKQADGTTSRKYGGTGLGLSISREIAERLGGRIGVESEEGKGSTFTFVVGDYSGPAADDAFASALPGLPADPVPAVPSSAVSASAAPSSAALSFAALSPGATPPDAVSPDATPPADASLDAPSPGGPSPAVPSSGAVPGARPPGADERIKKLLIVDDDDRQRGSLMELIGGLDVVITAVSSGAEALELLKVDHYDCMVLDLGLGDTTGFELMEELKERGLLDRLRVFVYTGRELDSREEMRLRKSAHTIIIKDERAPERLLEELRAYLAEAAAGAETGAAAGAAAGTEAATGSEAGGADSGGAASRRGERGARADAAKEGAPGTDGSRTDADAPQLAGKSVLLIDDDVRNVFAISNILEMYGMQVIYAENGMEGLDILRSMEDGPHLVLMDIMMPVMDGYETIREIRANPRFRDLPIIALTAKAMKEDREKCLEAGASDYIAKPVDPDQLISLIQVWLCPDRENRR